MTKHLVADLIGTHLDAAVALTEGWTWYRNKRDGVTVKRPDGTGFEAGNYPPKFDSETGRPVAPMGVVEALNAYDGDICYSSDWRLGGPIIERERIVLDNEIDSDVFREGEAWWTATVKTANTKTQVFRDFTEQGETALIAAMRAYVASRFGETVELP